MGFFRPTPKEKGIKGATGAESEAVIAATLIQAGYTVLTPNGYIIPIEDTPNTMRLRLTDRSRNGQTKGIKYAADYEL